MDSESNVANDILQKYWLPQDSVQVGSLIATGAYGRVYAGTVFENYSKCRIWILAFSTDFGPIKNDLYGNTVWPQASGFQKLAKMDFFLAFLINFCLLKM